MSVFRVPPISKNVIPVIIPGNKLICVDEQYYIENRNSHWELGQSWINAHSALVWQLCEQKLSIAEIIDALVEAYPDNVSQISDDVAQIIRQFFKRRIIDIVCDGKAISKSTYHVSLSVLVANVLNESGWRKALPDECAEFGFFVRSASNIRVAKYQTFNLCHTHALNDKSLMAKRIIKSGNGEIIPETYSSYESFSREVKGEKKGLWFVKRCDSGRQKHEYSYYKAYVDRTRRRRKSLFASKKLINPIRLNLPS